MDKIHQINKVLRDYFEHNPSISKIRAKDMMPDFILEGIFEKDIKNGLPIRTILRQLDQKNALNQIPYVYAERKTANTNWFFQRTGSSNLTSKTGTKQNIQVNSQKLNNRKDSDEFYVLNLCDIIFNREGVRQHRFDFLLGDPNKNVKCARLPVDIYYPDLNLVVEYKEPQHLVANKHFDKPNRITVSGVHRGEQRKIYDQRRLDILPQHGIQVIEIFYSDFKVDSKNRILRNTNDLEKIKQLLKR